MDEKIEHGAESVDELSPEVRTRYGLIDDLFAAVESAERKALALHQRGECHLSKWSCSHCEGVR